MHLYCSIVPPELICGEEGLTYHLDHAQKIFKLPSLFEEHFVVKHVIEPSQILKIVSMTFCLQHRSVSNS